MKSWKTPVMPPGRGVQQSIFSHRQGLLRCQDVDRGDDARRPATLWTEYLVDMVGDCLRSVFSHWVRLWNTIHQ